MNVSVPGCPVYTFDGHGGRPRGCTGDPTHTAVVRYRARRGWVRVFPCARHAGDVPGAEPMGEAHRRLLAARRADWAAGLAGRRYSGPPVGAGPDAV